jgi:prepilin-type N-terminal cleavage/methylation domain-containing protein
MKGARGSLVSPGTTSRAGFTLIEAIMSMAILATVMVMLSQLSLTVGRRAYVNDLTTKRNLAVAQQADRLYSLSFDQVAALGSGTTQMLVGDFMFNRRLTVTATTTSRYTIKVVIAPIAAEFTPDSVTISRTRPAAGTPLCTTC